MISSSECNASVWASPRRCHIDTSYANTDLRGAGSNIKTEEARADTRKSDFFKFVARWPQCYPLALWTLSSYPWIMPIDFQSPGAGSELNSGRIVGFTLSFLVKFDVFGYSRMHYCSVALGTSYPLRVYNIVTISWRMHGNQAELRKRSQIFNLLQTPTTNSKSCIWAPLRLLVLFHSLHISCRLCAKVLYAWG